MSDWQSTITPPALARLLRATPASATAGRQRRPAYRALAAQVQRLVSEGRLPVGTRMPAERELAAALELSRTTIATAYETLRAEGYLHSRRGSGSWTALPAGSSPPTDALFPLPPDSCGQLIDLGAASPAAPQPLLAEAAARAMEQLPAYALGHGHYPTGVPVLREAVAQRFTERGLPTTPDQILITTGAMSALDLVRRGLLRRGDRVAVESPSYAHQLRALRQSGARLVPVPQHRPQGAEQLPRWDLDDWRQVLRGASPRLAYLIPDFHNPTGALIGEEQRRELLAAARAAGTTVLADETMAELGWGTDRMPRPMAALDRTAEVVTVGSAGKLIWGGLRVGWIRASPALVRRLAADRIHIDVGTPVLDQLICAALIGERFTELREHRLARLRESVAALLPALREHLPSWRFAEPAGGMTLWLDTAGLSGAALARAGEQLGLRIAMGSRFGTDGAFEAFVRLPLTVPAAAATTTAERLAAAAAVAAAEQGRHGAPAAEALAV
ncbi:PLP-dependent aminotransferase family protein [Kitasatospora sp. NBC_01287]|uniref:MocR-like transcription factor YczR n=1 Tax=Kitasatospora sp. NBC_01287 TaxID=2903573 RepID=UPI0022529183|nr:PLP-dependent aminotransferase family protein [Kitasatospora sp. NBC_01287]MCX4746015.1 PLP-dependent aminotransferase family protein [Kitasatospora sp. NBC_01287]